jgi:ActR/RegA family two-component response regulator
MVGIARRVEEAIAALATKPDPKIVTLQLDELDGLRLTVALRPDGLHLSSTGDTALTTEIERALAARGFDMASSGDAERQGSEDTTDDGWRPQPTPPGRQRRSNQSGIRL